jgi:hypothetical protein
MQWKRFDKEITWYDFEHEKMQSGNEKYDKYSHDDDDYAEKKMMKMINKDKEY